MSTSTHFPDNNELKRFARNFVTVRISALQKDVNHCLQPPFAPMPAIIWCLATIDLFGGLVAGQASKKDPTTGKSVNTTQNTQYYLRQFMGYTQDQTDLIIEIFRHKLVHLAQPRNVFSHNGKAVTWQYVHENTSDHLILKDSPLSIHIKSDWQVNVDQVFTLGITQFMQDIIDSVIRHGGYLDKLETDPNILGNFRNAIEQTYTP
jgi:hypothetical protein